MTAQMPDACWICLCDKKDESGELPVRDCSCRGSAGFAHLSCLVKYAKTKAEPEAQVGRLDGASEPWKVCPNCRQQYAGLLAINLTGEFIDWSVDQFPMLLELHVEAMSLKVRAVRNHCVMFGARDPQFIREGKRVADLCLAKIDSTKKLLKMAGAQKNVDNLLGQEAFIYMTLVTIDPPGTMNYLVEGRDVCKSEGNDFYVAQFEQLIAMAESNFADPGQQLESIQWIRDQGGDQFEGVTDSAVFSSLSKADGLIKCNRCIEAERLVSKLSLDCQRVLGPDHSKTKLVEMQLTNCKERRVMVGNRVFQALRYKSGDAGKVIVQGPIMNPRVVQSEKKSWVSVEKIGLFRGTPVECVGLTKAAHLNGKIGDYRNVDTDTGRLVVHFEKEGLKPAAVKQENLRIVFKLPDE